MESRQVNFITRGWPNGYTNIFIEQLKIYLQQPAQKFLFIASDFANHAKAQYYLQQCLQQFGAHDITFQQIDILDYMITPDKAVKLIEEADIICISRRPYAQTNFSIHEYGLAPALRGQQGITIGNSAGSINMAKRVVLAKDMSDDIPELSIYEGIGLTNINIEPHLGDASFEHMEEIRQAARYVPMYGLYDESFILEVNGDKRFFGPYQLFQ